MVETTLLKEPLTPEMISIGSRLTAELDRMGLPIIASFWLFESESNNWKLRIATPERETRGSVAVQEKIKEAIKAIGLSHEEFALRNVGLVWSNDKLVLALQEEFKEGPATTPIWWGRGAIRKVYVDDAYIYRVN